MTQFAYPVYYRFAGYLTVIIYGSFLLYFELFHSSSKFTVVEGILILIFIPFLWGGLQGITHSRKSFNRLVIDEQQQLIGVRKVGNDISFPLKSIKKIFEDRNGQHCGYKNCSQHTICIESSSKEIIAIAPYLGGLNVLIKEIRKANPSVEITIDKEYYADENFD